MATLTKEDLYKPLIPERCKDCEHLCISHATGLTRKSGHSVATCKLNHAGHGCDELRGTYEPCSNVISLNPIYKCKYDNKERLA
jgi:hypothetical protein